MTNQNKNQLDSALTEIIQPGIAVDRRRLKEDMCAQFADPREWIREIIANSHDAGATLVQVSGREADETLTIRVEDNGSGMDRRGLLDYMTIFRSHKDGRKDSTIGRHGVGKMSVAAVPGQCGFYMSTSTGEEAWEMEMGCLLDEEPIQLKKVKPVAPKGTVVEVTFKKKNSLLQELEGLMSVVDRYLAYLPGIEIRFYLPQDQGEDDVRILIPQDFTRPMAPITYSKKFTIGGKKYEGVLTFGGNTESGIYQNRIFITGKYNLLSHGLKGHFSFPHLSVMVDSTAFELPFGRHCLCNEEVLIPLARHLRKVLLPDFYHRLYQVYMDRPAGEYPKNIYRWIEELSLQLMKWSDHEEYLWIHLPMFRDVHWTRYSLFELKQLSDKGTRFYLEPKGHEGLDFSQVDGVVLAYKQVHGGMDFLKTALGDHLESLVTSDEIMEELGGAQKLTDREKMLGRCLQFHPRAIEVYKSKVSSAKDEKFLPRFMLRTLEKDSFQDGKKDGSYRGRSELESLRWQVNYLVKVDGTPCRSHLFILKKNEVVLNLHHPEITDLVRLSTTHADLAGHMGLAICLTDKSGKILPGLSLLEKERLLYLDAVAKCLSSPPVEKRPDDSSKERRDFFFNLASEE